MVWIRRGVVIVWREVRDLRMAESVAGYDIIGAKREVWDLRMAGNL